MKEHVLELTFVPVGSGFALGLGIGRGSKLESYSGRHLVPSISNTKHAGSVEIRQRDQNDAKAGQGPPVRHTGLLGATHKATFRWRPQRSTNRAERKVLENCFIPG